MVLQALLVARGGVVEEGEVEAMALELNTRSKIKVAKLPTFNRNATKILGFIIAYRLYIRIRMRNFSVEKKIQWVYIGKNQQIFIRKI